MMDDNVYPEDIELMHFLDVDYVIIRDRETGFIVYDILIKY